MLAGLVSPEASLLGLQMATFLLCPHLPFFLCVPLVSLPLLIRALILLDLGLTLMISLNLNHLLKTLSPNTVTLGVKASKHELRGGGNGTVSPIIPGKMYFLGFCLQK